MKFRIYNLQVVYTRYNFYVPGCIATMKLLLRRTLVLSVCYSTRETVHVQSKT